MKRQTKKKPSPTSANSSNISACVQIDTSNKHYSNTFLSCPETLHTLAQQMLQELDLLMHKHFDYWRCVQTESRLDQYKALVIFDNKEVQDA